MITIIAAVTRSGAIGRRGDLVCHISADLKHFKALTMGHPVVMGRLTFESLPGGALPGRRNIVISSQTDYTAPGAEVYPSLEQALKAVGEEDCFIIGGGRVYAEALPLADRLSLTEIDTDGPADADTFFPTVDPAVWEVAGKTETTTDPRTGLTYSFVDYRRC